MGNNKNNQKLEREHILELSQDRILASLTLLIQALHSLTPK